MLVEAGNRGNILDYTVWSSGTSGSESGFPTNGAALENYRTIDTGPQGNKIAVWEARPDLASAADGGWNTNTFPVDNTKMYRFSMWIRRTVQGDGFAYLGLSGYGSISGVLQRSNASNNTNPYFYVTGTPSPTTGEWALWVGHVWPKGSGAGGQHSESGLYTVENGRIGNISQDFVWREETTSANHRAYLFYSTDTATRQQFCYPRVDLCDGSEPTIEDLLSGIDERWEGAGFPTTTSIRENTVTPNLSEIGVTRGLVAWYPLIGDTKDYAGTNHATNNGAVATAEGYDLSDPATFIDIAGVDRSDLKNCSVSFLRKKTITGSWLPFNSSRGGSNFLMASSTGNFYHRNVGSSVATYVDGIPRNSPINDDEWHLYTATGVNLSSWPGLLMGGYSNFELKGAIRDVRLHNVALTPEEVAIQAKLALNPETKIAMTQNCLYTKGQIKEVIV